MSVEITSTSLETTNRLYALSRKKDEKIDELFNRLVQETDSLEDSSLSNNKRYDIVVSIEFLLFRLRVLIDTEHAIVKRILNDQETPAAMKPFFTKRDVYLAQLCQKLTNMRDDISVIQKLIYTNSTFNIH